jgi:hypothetical protein
MTTKNSSVKIKHMSLTKFSDKNYNFFFLMILVANSIFCFVYIYIDRQTKSVIYET